MLRIGYIWPCIFTYITERFDAHWHNQIFGVRESTDAKLSHHRASQYINRLGNGPNVRCSLSLSPSMSSSHVIAWIKNDVNFFLYRGHNFLCVIFAHQNMKKKQPTTINDFVIQSSFVWWIRCRERKKHSASKQNIGIANNRKQSTSNYSWIIIFCAIFSILFW